MDIVSIEFKISIRVNYNIKKVINQIGGRNYENYKFYDFNEFFNNTYSDFYNYYS